MKAAIIRLKIADVTVHAASYINESLRTYKVLDNSRMNIINKAMKEKFDILER